MNRNLIPILSLLLLASCNGGKESKENAVMRMQAEQTENYVDTMTLRLTDFNRELVCNGRLCAAVKSMLVPRHSDLVTSILVREGQWVEQGTLLAVTDETDYLREVERAERDLEKTRVDLADKLLQLGYDVDSDLNPRSDVPTDILRRAEVTSGHYAAQYQLQTARRNLNDCRLTAPVSGRIADLEAHLHQRAEKFCNIIDDRSFGVEFNVLEAELPIVSTGHRVRVTPFTDDSLMVAGNIVSVNPTVSEKGLVKVTAQIPGHNGFVDGMNVRVVVERKVPRMFVVPKDAVVERDGYNVIFLYDNGHARWTYVDIVASNITGHAITGCARKETTLHEGDVVITSGNLNLADNTPVRIRE